MLSPIDALIAKDAIRDVLMRYSCGVDRCDAELLKTCFHVSPDGIVKLTKTSQDR